jgi:rhamnulokinase
MGRTFAAVDLGASSGRVLAGRLERGRLVADETTRFPNTPVPVVTRGRTTLHTDLLGLWSGVRAGLRAAAREHGPVASVGVDTWAVDYGLLDDGGRLLGDPVHYRDERTAGAPERFFRYLDRARHYAVTGAQVQPFNTAFQLVAARGDASFAAARGLLLVPDLLGAWLTGDRVTEVTNASTTGLLDAGTRRWSAEVLAAAAAAAGRDVGGLLAPLVEPGTVLGAVQPAVADDLGLAGTRWVAVGSHDTASAVAAVPMTDPATAAYISSGTWSLVGLELDAPVRTEASRAANVTNELGVDGTVRYLRNVAGLWLLQESVRTWTERGDAVDLPALLAAAADVPALRTVIDVDHPSLLAPGDMPRRIADLARAAGEPVPEDPAAVVRCVLDSLALAYRHAVRTVADLAGRRVEVVHVVGGGSRNALLCRLTAQATGLPVVAGPAESTALGNLLVQAWGMGELDGGLPAIREVVRASVDVVRFEPSGAPGGSGAAAVVGDDAAWERAGRRLAAARVATTPDLVRG